MMKKINIIAFAGLLLLLSNCKVKQPKPSAFRAPAYSSFKNPLPVGVPFPKAPREFRAAWVATVANINWPTSPSLSTEQQQEEALNILDFLKNHHFNAVIFQVRPQADALYKSDLEPWSYFLTGEQGKAPDPYYDPLEFWVKEAHERGLELHVWLNPYRAHHPQGQLNKAVSLVEKMGNSVVHLKEGYWWFDPSKQETQAHSLQVVQDITRRYDIDGVHFDDYFYPYESYNGGDDFPDLESYQHYQQSGGSLSRNDWRREQVNQFIEQVYLSIKHEKPHVKFGISPFGIWRPGYPASVSGMDQYDKLYADAKLWLNKGWLDYFTPQLYWPINQLPQSFPVLLGWWKAENTLNRHLWPGMNVGRGGDEQNVDEVINQIQITRGMLPKSMGAVHWSMSSLTKNPLLAEGILRHPYLEEALIPETPWLATGPAPSAPKLDSENQVENLALRIAEGDNENIQKWVVYFKYRGADHWHYSFIDRKDQTKLVRLRLGDQALETVGVTTVDRVGRESQPTVITSF